jgi:hypothetical protein
MGKSSCSCEILRLDGRNNRLGLRVPSEHAVSFGKNSVSNLKGFLVASDLLRVFNRCRDDVFGIGSAAERRWKGRQAGS